jgi:hypothetical protein
MFLRIVTTGLLCGVAIAFGACSRGSSSQSAGTKRKRVRLLRQRPKLQHPLRRKQQLVRRLN